MPHRTFNSHRHKHLRQKLRRRMTVHERILWCYLRGRRVAGFKFRTQVGVDRYIVDFFCFQRLLAVELDGHQHETPVARGYDEIRDAFLRGHGITVLRFPNSAVDADVLEVVNRIEAVILTLPDRPKPPIDFT